MTSEDLTGMTGRVVTPIDVDAPGEVMISVRGGAETFIASSDDGKPIANGTSVTVVEYNPPRHVVVAEY